MASPNVYQIGFKFAVTLLLFYSLALLPSISGRGKEMRMVLGSSPPKCVGRCMGCRPCVAALVIPPHDHKVRGPLSAHFQIVAAGLPRHPKNGNYWFKRPSSSGGDESYYLLSWKCRCGNKYFQP